MFSLSKKKYIGLVVLVLIISATILFYKYNKSIPQDLLFFKVTSPPNLEKSQTAAILLLTPIMGQFYIGDTMKVVLVVNVLGQLINVVDGKITFPSDKLELIDISKENSIVSLWVQDPTVFSDSNGFIYFTGGLPSPGFTGISGQIITILFKVKKDGNAEIRLEDAHVLANDGVGTDILAKTTPARLTLLKSEAKKIVADINEDSKIDFIDISILLSNIGTSDPKTDLNGDGKVNVKDLSVLLSRWPH